MSNLSQSDPLPLLHRAALASGSSKSPLEIFDVLSDALNAAFGHRLCTVLRYHRGSGETERFFTSNPQAYPVGGRKPPNPTFWTQQLFVEARPYIGRNAEDIRAVFFDHELILSLGCESILNLPVYHDGAVIGTINILERAGWFDESDIPVGQMFAALAVPAFLRLEP